MKKKINVKKILLILGVIVLVAVAGLGVYNMFFNGEWVNIKGQKLNSYTEASGGDMNGSHRSFSIKRVDDQKALVSYSKARWYGEDPAVEEYYTDVKVLDEIDAVVRKYHMNRWNNKKFTNMFIADAGNDSYYFTYDEEYISFSSQYYPSGYAKKLAEIDEVVKPYTENLAKLPGLVVPANEEWNLYIPVEHEVGLYASQYCEGKLYLKLVNDTEETVKYTRNITVTDPSTGKILASNDSTYEEAVNPHYTGEEYIKIDERLVSGTYEAKLGDYICTFVIE